MKSHVGQLCELSPHVKSGLDRKMDSIVSGYHRAGEVREERRRGPVDFWGTFFFGVGGGGGVFDLLPKYCHVFQAVAMRQIRPGSVAF